MAGMNGSDSAEQVVHIVFQGVDLALRLTGSATKNLAQLIILAANQDGVKVKRGEVRNIVQLLRSNKPLQTYQMNIEDLKFLKKNAKKYGILYTAVKDSRSKDGLCDIILRQDDIPMFNALLNAMGLKGAIPVADTKASNSLKKNGDLSMTDLNTTKVNSMHGIDKTPDELKTIISDINSGEKNAFTDDNWKNYLVIHSAHYNYSTKNQSLINEQMSHATLVLSKSKWRELGRFPKQDASGINIVRPEIINHEMTGNFIPSKVYDISETDGRTISPSELTIQFSEGSAELKCEIERLTQNSSIPIEYVKDLETPSVYDSNKKVIYLRDGLNDVELYRALIEETVYSDAHAQLGENYLRINHQLNADSTSYALMNKYGLDTSEFSFDYLPTMISSFDDQAINTLVNQTKDSITKQMSASDKNLSQFTHKQKTSVKGQLENYKDSITLSIPQQKSVAKVR